MRVKSKTVSAIPVIPPGGLAVHPNSNGVLSDAPIGEPVHEEVMVEVLPEKIHHHKHHYLASKHSAGHGIHHHSHTDHNADPVDDNPNHLLVANKRLNPKARKRELLKKIIRSMGGHVDDGSSTDTGIDGELSGSGPGSASTPEGENPIEDVLEGSLGSRTESGGSYDSAYDDIVYRAPVRENQRHCRLLQYDPINPLLPGSKGFDQNPDSPPSNSDTLIPHESQLPKNLFSYKKNKRTFFHSKEVLETKQELSLTRSQSMKNINNFNPNSTHNELNNMNMSTSTLPVLSQSLKDPNPMNSTGMSTLYRTTSLTLPDIKASQTQLLMNLMNKSTNSIQSIHSNKSIEQNSIELGLELHGTTTTNNNSSIDNTGKVSKKNNYDRKYKKLETLQSQQVDIYRKMTQSKVSNPNDIYQTPALNDPYGKKYQLQQNISDLNNLSNLNEKSNQKNNRKQLTTFGLSQLMHEK